MSKVSRSVSRYLIAYDCTLMRPGCALLQAAMGASLGIANRFSTKTWLLAPTADLRVHPVTEEQLRVLVKKTEEMIANNRPHKE